jgi:uncharacterized membrane protein YjgN (DUF898 family)
MKARFEASLTQYVVRLVGWVVVTLITLGIGGIWVGYDQAKWPVENSSLGDRKVTFTATFASFLGKLVIWALISIVTLGIGGIWVAYDAIKWLVDHIEVDGQSFAFQGTFAEYLGKILIWVIVSVVTFGLGAIWVVYDSIKWTVEHSRYGAATPVLFTSTFAEFIGKVVIWFLVSALTFGIGAIWANYDYYCWLATAIEMEGATIVPRPLLAAA